MNSRHPHLLLGKLYARARRSLTSSFENDDDEDTSIGCNNYKGTAEEVIVDRPNEGVKDDEIGEIEGGGGGDDDSLESTIMKLRALLKERENSGGGTSNVSGEDQEERQPQSWSYLEQEELPADGRLILSVQVINMTI